MTRFLVHTNWETLNICTFKVLNIGALLSEDQRLTQSRDPGSDSLHLPSPCPHPRLPPAMLATSLTLSGQTHFRLPISAPVVSSPSCPLVPVNVTPVRPFRPCYPVSPPSSLTSPCFIVGGTLTLSFHPFTCCWFHAFCPSPLQTVSSWEAETISHLQHHPMAPQDTWHGGSACQLTELLND